MKKVLINVEERELRVAILEDEQLTELYIEQLGEKTILNNIYKGRIEGILPGLKAAFVNIGLERNAFLHFDDVRGDLLWAKHRENNPSAEVPQRPEAEAAEDEPRQDRPAQQQPEAVIHDIAEPAEAGEQSEYSEPMEAASSENADGPAGDSAAAADYDANRRRRRGRRGGKRRNKTEADQPFDPIRDEVLDADIDDEDEDEMAASASAEAAAPPVQAGLTQAESAASPEGDGQVSYSEAGYPQSAYPQSAEQQRNNARSERQKRRRDRWEQKKLERKLRRQQGGEGGEFNRPPVAAAAEGVAPAPVSNQGGGAGGNFDRGNRFDRGNNFDRGDRGDRGNRGNQGNPGNQAGGRMRAPQPHPTTTAMANAWVPPAERGAVGTRGAANPYDVFSPYSMPQQPSKRQWRRQGQQETNSWGNARNPYQQNPNDHRDSQEDFFGPRPAARVYNPADDEDERQPYFGPARGAQPVYDDEDIDGPMPGNEKFPNQPSSNFRPRQGGQSNQGGQGNNQNANRKRRGGRNRQMKRRGPAYFASRAKKTVDEDAAVEAPKKRTRKAAEVEAPEPKKAPRAKKAVAAEVVAEAKPRAAKKTAVAPQPVPEPKKATTRAKKAAPAPVAVAVPAPAPTAAPAAEKKPSRRTKKSDAAPQQDMLTPQAETKAAPAAPAAPVQAAPAAPAAEAAPAARRGRRKKGDDTTPQAPAGQQQPPVQGGPAPVAQQPTESSTSAPTDAPTAEGSAPAPQGGRSEFQRPDRGRDRDRRGRRGRRGRGGFDTPPTQEGDAPAQTHSADQQGQTADQSAGDESTSVDQSTQTAPTDQQAPTGQQRPPRHERQRDRHKDRDRNRDRGPREPREQRAPREQREPRDAAPRRWNRPPLFTETYKKGDEIMVQVIKEEIGMKGARISTYISMPGRYLVLLPYPNEEGGISRKVEDITERKRLKRILKEISNDETAFIIRTAGIYRDEADIRGDVDFLKGEWRQIAGRYKEAEPTTLVYDDHDILYRLARDVFDDNVTEIQIDSHVEGEKLKAILNKLIPSLQERVKVYSGSENIFQKFGVEKQIQKAARRKVWLKSGGYLIIDEAEALTAIDVNTGKAVGKDDQEKLILKTNTEAARAVARELKLRDIGGLIVIDFIDMKDPRNRDLVVNELKANLRRDRSKTSVSTISEFGLVEMTRKRVRRSLRKTLFMDCPYCQGAGVVLNEQQIWLHIKHEMVKMLESAKPAPSINVTVNSRIRAHVDMNYREAIRRLEQRYDAEIRFSMSDVFHVENYAIEKLGAAATPPAALPAAAGGR